MKKLSVAHVIGCIDPQSGGPTESEYQLLRHMVKLDVKPQVFSFHYPFDDRACFWDDIDVKHLHYNANSVYRAGWNPQAEKEFYEWVQRGKIQIIHNQGLWLFPNIYARRSAQKFQLPLITSVRGMLEPWTLRQNYLKKKIAWFLYEKKNLGAVDIFHATSEQEAESIRRLGFRQPIAVIPNGVSIDPLQKALVAPPSERILLFLSRIHPKKGLERLLLVWEKIFKQFPQWKLAIAGEGENEYVARLKRKAQEYGLGSSVIWTGFVEKEKKKELFLQSELFILPSFSENFGNVISEALSFGVPVITTQNTPWKILETQKCGWWVKSDEIALEKALKASLAASPEELSQMGQRGRQMVQELYDWAQISSQMSAVYRWALHEGEKPDCVRLS